MQNYQNQSQCEYADNLVSYLYGEIGDGEDAGFEMHLAKCSGCADELAAFSEVRFAVTDWRKAEFDQLSLPEIVIPYEQTIPHSLVGEKQNSRFGDFVTALSFNWKTAAAFAAILICASLIFLTVKSSRTNETAKIIQNDQSLSGAIANNNSPFEKPIQQENVGNVKNEVAENKSVAVKNAEIKKLLAPNAPVVQLQKRRNIAPQAVELEAKFNSPVKLKTNSLVASIPPSSKIKAVQTLSSISEDEDLKDDSLRLSELLDEADDNE